MCRRLALITVVLLTISCATDSSDDATIFMNVERKVPVEVSDGVDRVAVEVRDGDTIIRFNDARITCKGYEGFLGRFSPRRGWIRVGKLHLSYELPSVQVRGPGRWVPLEITPGLKLFAQQDGQVGRSVFKE